MITFLLLAFSFNSIAQETQTPLDLYAKIKRSYEKASDPIKFEHLPVLELAMYDQDSQVVKNFIEQKALKCEYFDSAGSKLNSGLLYLILKAKGTGPLSENTYVPVLADAKVFDKKTVSHFLSYSSAAQIYEDMIWQKEGYARATAIGSTFHIRKSQDLFYIQISVYYVSNSPSSPRDELLKVPNFSPLQAICWKR